MILRKITVDISLRYVPKSEKAKEKEIKPKAVKVGSLPRKQNKNISQKVKKIPKNIAASGFAIIKGIMNCYFYLKNIQTR